MIFWAGFVAGFEAGQVYAGLSGLLLLVGSIAGLALYDRLKE